VLAVGSTLGILGGGQLGRMTALEARRLGFRTVVLDPDPHSPGAQVADQVVQGNLADAAAMRALAQQAQAVTYEFENVDASAVAALEALVPVHPSSRVLSTSQHRLREKTALSALGVPVPAFRSASSPAELEQALAELPLPVVLKTATGGYDGKGQARIYDAREALDAFHVLHQAADALIVEELVDLALELSVICVRDARGHLTTFPPIENQHHDGILDVSIAPARVPDAVRKDARAMACRIAQGLDLVGVLAVEMFWTTDGRLLANELAPRPHNSGHLTIEAAATSQFEQLVRVLAGWPLGSTALVRPAAMANLLGDWWPHDGRSPDFARMVAVPGVRLHLYGKAEPRPGRKMGHLTALAASAEEARALVLEARGPDPRL